MVAFITRLMLVSAALLATAGSARAQQPPIAGAWVGSYTCSQGLTGLTLTLHAPDTGEIAGYFHFYPQPTNTVAKEGCYSVRGRVDPDGTIAIEAVRWMTQPEGYVTVDLIGRVDALGQTMAGNVIALPGFGAACTTFEIKRRSPQPRISPLCHAGIAQAGPR